MVITFRPEFSPPWIDQAHVTSVALSRLGNRQTTAVVGGITGGKALPQEILARIVERTDGIPLFVEELTKAVGPLPQLAIPSSLQASLLARLDRLMPVKEVAQLVLPSVANSLLSCSTQFPGIPRECYQLKGVYGS
jgi:predicted ATPase